MEVLITSLADGRRVLPVFSFEEEAILYLRLGIRGSWQVRQTQGGELLSLLCCLCNKIELVALDPMSAVESDMMDRLVSLERERFIDVLLRREASVRLSPDASQTTQPSAGAAGSLVKPRPLRPGIQEVRTDDHTRLTP